MVFLGDLRLFLRTIFAQNRCKMPCRPKLMRATQDSGPPCYTPPMPSDRRELPDEPPPFLRTWPRVYTAVVVYLALLITACYAFTRLFS